MFEVKNKEYLDGILTTLVISEPGDLTRYEFVVNVLSKQVGIYSKRLLPVTLIDREAVIAFMNQHPYLLTEELYAREVQQDESIFKGFIEAVNIHNKNPWTVLAAIVCAWRCMQIWNNEREVML